LSMLSRACDGAAVSFPRCDGSPAKRGQVPEVNLSPALEPPRALATPVCPDFSPA
jgi:hypothetical protein